MKIKVSYVPTEYELGTQDGQSWRLYPIEDCSCEPWIDCFIHANKFTEKH